MPAGQRRTIHVRVGSSDIAAIEQRQSEREDAGPSDVFEEAVSSVLDDLDQGQTELTVAWPAGPLVRRKYGLTVQTLSRLEHTERRTGHRRQRIARAALTRLASDLKDQAIDTPQG